MHIDECKDGNLVFCSINWDYSLNPSNRYSKLVLIDSSCNLIKELKIDTFYNSDSILVWLDRADDYGSRRELVEVHFRMVSLVMHLQHSLTWED